MILEQKTFHLKSLVNRWQITS